MTYELSIREATREDCKSIYEWRNHSINCQYSTGCFIYEEHCEWFDNYLNDDDNLMLIISVNGYPACVVRFDGAFDEKWVSIYMTPGYHGKGYSLICLLFAEKYLQARSRGLKCNFYARIDPKNKASMSLFSRAGYIYSLTYWHKIA